MKFEDFWKTYKSEAMHPDSPADQINECKIAFYCGAKAMFAVMVEQVGDDDVTEDQGADLMEVVRWEVEKEIQSIIRGKGKQ